MWFNFTKRGRYEINLQTVNEQNANSNLYKKPSPNMHKRPNAIQICMNEQKQDQAGIGESFPSRPFQNLQNVKKKLSKEVALMHRHASALEFDADNNIIDSSENTSSREETCSSPIRPNL